jgi:hypothetical protein
MRRRGFQSNETIQGYTVASLPTADFLVAVLFLLRVGQRAFIITQRTWQSITLVIVTLVHVGTPKQSIK